MKYLRGYFYLIYVISSIVLMFVFEEERNMETFKSIIKKESLYIK